MWTDIVVAFRSWVRAPIFAATAIATLALGIGASSAIFSLVDAVLLAPLPYRDPARLVRIWEARSASDADRAMVAAANASDWQARSRVFDDLALFNVSAERTVLEIGDASLQARQAAVTTNLFDLLGVRPTLGRSFGIVPEGRGPLDGREVVLSHGLWLRAFGGDPLAIGRPLRIEGARGSVVVGVMPPEFDFPEDTDFWTPMVGARSLTGARDLRWYGSVGRLAEGVDVGTARQQLAGIAAALAIEHPATSGGWTVAVLPLHESIVGSHRLVLITLLAAVSFVMLVGCANVSNLLLARGVGRRSELSVRAALGASRSRLARLLLTEAVLLAALGTAGGLVCAWLALPLLVQLAGQTVPRIGDAHMSGLTTAFSGGVALIAAMVAGLMPALRLSRAEATDTLVASGTRSTARKSDTRLLRLVLAAQLAVCLVLLVGAMLFARTFRNLLAVDLGFEPGHVVSVETRAPIYGSLAPNRWQRLALQTQEALDRVRAVPGVLAAAATNDLPLAGSLIATEVTLPGESSSRQVLYHRVSPEYFRTMGMSLVQGRDFTSQDMSDLARLADPGAAEPRQGAVIVNETTARAFWPTGNAIGQFLSTSFDARPVSRRRVVGIVRDVRSESIRGGPPAEVYVPYLEDPSFAMTLLVRSQEPTPQVISAVRRELRAVSPDLSTAEVRTLDDVVADALRPARFGAYVVSAFAVTGLLLSTLGVFGVFAFGVASRWREIGIRMALGATHGAVIRVFLTQALGPIAAGIALGVAGSVVLGRLVGTLLFGVPSTDLTSYAAAAAALAGCALIASYVPVRRALRADPARALRE